MTVPSALPESKPASPDAARPDGPAPETLASVPGVCRGIGKGLVLFALSLVACAAMTLGVWVFQDKAETRRVMGEQRFHEARDRYRQLDGEMALVSAYLPRFQRLVEAGFIGEERRLTWLEALRGAALRIGLPALDYDISSRRPYPMGDFPLDTGPYRIHASEMQLVMGLLHGQDLFSLLAELDRHAVGLYRVEYCRLRRVGRESWRDPGQANLNAECVLRWYSLARSKGASARGDPAP